jgi:hypothetical protein
MKKKYVVPKVEDNVPKREYAAHKRGEYAFPNRGEWEVPHRGKSEVPNRGESAVPHRGKSEAILRSAEGQQSPPPSQLSSPASASLPSGPPLRTKVERDTLVGEIATKSTLVGKSCPSFCGKPHKTGCHNRPPPAPCNVQKTTIKNPTGNQSGYNNFGRLPSQWGSSQGAGPRKHKAFSALVCAEQTRTGRGEKPPPNCGLSGAEPAFLPRKIYPGRKRKQFSPC